MKRAGRHDNQCAQRAIGIDKPTQAKPVPRLRSGSLRYRSPRSRSPRTPFRPPVLPRTPGVPFAAPNDVPTADPTSPRSIAAREARGDHIASLHRIGGDAQHTSQIVAPTSRQHAQQSIRDLTQDIRHRSDHPVAAETYDRLATAGRFASELTGMIEVPREFATHAKATALQSGSHLWQHPARFAASGGRVHDQAKTLAHHASVLGRANPFGLRLSRAPIDARSARMESLDTRPARTGDPSTPHGHRPSVLGIAKTRLRTCEHRPQRLTARLCCPRCPLALPLRVCWSAPEPRRWAWS